MLKACWDCLAGEAQRSGEDSYGVRMNGSSNTTHWQNSTQNGKMFAVPIQLKENDEIVIKGNMTDGLLDIGLRPDSSQDNIVCQLNVVYPQHQSHNQMVLRNVVNGVSNTLGEYIASHYFDDTTFEVTIFIESDQIRLMIGASDLPQTVPLQPSDIRFISVIGEVKELIFRFNQTHLTI